MSDKRKCFWLELAAWAVLILDVILGSFLSSRVSYDAEKWIGILALIPPWVVSLFAYNAWTGIPQEERDRLDKTYRRAAYLRVLTPKYIVGFLPVMCPVVAVLAAIL